MDLIDRYILAVTKKLPEASREDASKSLRSDIEKQLPANPTKEEVNAVLKELGDPWLLADKYQPVKKYLIGPSLYRPYVWMLKLVLTISVILAVVFTIFDWVINTGITLNFVDDVVPMFIQLGAAVISSGIQAAFWVTIAFVLIEKSGVGADELPFRAKDWSPDDLPKDVATDKAIIPRSETVFELIFLVIFAGLFFFRPQWLGMYSNLEGEVAQSIPLFNIERLQFYLPFILLLLAFELIIAIWKFIWGRWYKSLAITNLVFNLASAVILIIMGLDNQLLNPDFFVRLNEIFGNGNMSVAASQMLFIRVTLGIILLITVIDSLLPFFKLSRKNPFEA